MRVSCSWHTQHLAQYNAAKAANPEVYGDTDALAYGQLATSKPSEAQVRCLLGCFGNLREPL
jgi:hypothetical protein